MLDANEKKQIKVQTTEKESNLAAFSAKLERERSEEKQRERELVLMAAMKY